MELGDLRSSAFTAGDRVVVRVVRSLFPEERRRIQRAVEKMAGVELKVLIVDVTSFAVVIEGCKTLVVAGPEHAQRILSLGNINQVHVTGSKVDIEEGSKVVVSARTTYKRFLAFKSDMERWVGDRELTMFRLEK